MKKITLKTASGKSDMLIEKGLVEKLGPFLKKAYPGGGRPVVITDTNLQKIFGTTLKKTLPKNTLFIAIKPGEKAKQMPTVLSIAKTMLEEEVCRSDVVVGFGGGVITDLAGFVASIYMRGLPYVCVPTSVLGMVDAAIGGKTGVDFIVKNILGTVYLPHHVLIDPALAEGLPERQRRNGMGEIIKYAAMADASLFRDFEKNPPDLEKIIIKSVQAKVDVVKKDLRESGRRRWLNFGHTFGHAIEAESRFKIQHGEAISIGMVIANRVAQRLKLQKPEAGEKIRATLQAFGLPTELPPGIKIEALMKYVLNDKKRSGDKIAFVIAPRLGRATVVELMPDELFHLASTA